MSVDEAISFFGGVGALADALGIRSQSVSVWRGLNRVPRGRQFELEKITDGALKADEFPSKPASEKAA